METNYESISTLDEFGKLIKYKIPNYTNYFRRCQLIDVEIKHSSLNIADEVNLSVILDYKNCNKPLDFSYLRAVRPMIYSGYT